MRHTPLVSAVVIAAMACSAAPAMGAIGNRYNDGQDLAVSSAAGNNFRLDSRRLEPNCTTALAFGLKDVGDSNTSLDILNTNPTFSIDQMLVPGVHTGYQVVNQFDTGTITTDPDIDPGQTAVNINGPQRRDPITKALVQDDVALFGQVIVCYSDHDDSGQNEPYAHSNGGPGATDGVSDANEVYAKNRPIIKPSIASLGQGAVRGIKGYKLGLGYSIEKWYSTANAAAGGENSLLRLTDPMGFSLDKLVTTPVLGGTTTTVAIDTNAGHVRIPPRIAGPQFDAVSDGPGVLRVNDIDLATEQFDDPHFEFSNYDQTDVFNVQGDAQSFCLGGFSCAGIVAFGAQGDLPIKWTVKASLAQVESMRDVSFTPAMFDAWEQGWQDYYCGKAAHPTLALTPGTNSPDPRGACPVVNPPQTQPLPTPANPNPAPVNLTIPPVTVGAVTAPAAKTIADAVNAVHPCTSNRKIKVTWGKTAKSGKLIFRGKTIKARRVNGKLTATINVSGMVANGADYMKVTQVTKTKGGHTQSRVRQFKVC